ncbi:response regulator transcription factor [Oscillochloris sp. ZM17-4]
MAAQLTISENTIKSHLSRIFDKLGARSRTEAVTIAIQRGLLSTG